MSKRGDEPRVLPTEPALRVLMRRLRDIMAEVGDDQLFATEGLNQDAVHKTRLKRGEGLVGRCAEMKEPVNEADAPSHPAFSYRPETGEELYHSLLAVPILRSGELLGVLVIQNRTSREYSDEDVEVLQAMAMIVAEHLISGAVAGSSAAIELSKTLSHVIVGEPISEGIALGHAHLHEPRIVVTKLMADDPVAEMHRLTTALLGLRTSLDEMLRQEQLSGVGEHREVLEAFRMFAHDKGWERRLREAVESGLTAEAAIERVQNSTRARMLRQNDSYWRERQRDLDDLSDRLQRILAGQNSGLLGHAEMPHDMILIARNMGPAELLDYDRTRLRGVIVEDGSGTSHVAIVAKALGIAAVGQATGTVERVSAGDAVIVDAESGEVHLRPSAEVINAYSDKVRFRARRRQRYDALRDTPAVTKDGQKVSLHINAGLVVDMPHLHEAGADGVGLFRTELQFMLSHTFPRLTRQVQTYRQVLAEADGKPVVFRALDIGGDKVLPYLKQPQEENPALGWRAIRMSLDRPALFRTQIRAFLIAAAGRDLRFMVPMVTVAAEMDAVRRLVDKEMEILDSRRLELPRSIAIGAMFEVPSLLFELDSLMRRVDFLSVGSNDLSQFLFAADRTNPLVSKRFDPLSAPMLRALRSIVKAAERRRVPLTLCGELAGNPLTAMALTGIGFRSISMAPASIGPVKSMILSLDAGRVTALIEYLLKKPNPSIRAEFERFAEADSIEI